MLHPYITDTTTISFNKAFMNAGREQVTLNGNSYYKMQDMSSDICNAVTLEGEPSQTQLIDIRDNKLYWVAKLKDNKCWMTQNLDFDITGETLTSETTDLTSFGVGGYIESVEGGTQYGYTKDNTTGIISWTPANATIDATNIALGDTIPGWDNSDYYVPYSVNTGNFYTDGVWFNSGDGGCEYDKRRWGNCTNHISTTPYSGNGEHGHVGNYYNWTAAIAANNSNVDPWISNTYNDISNNPQNSVCPAGWRLPTFSAVAANNEFAKLNAEYNGGADNTDMGVFRAPLYFSRAGYIRNYQGGTADFGNYWSSTVGSSEGVYVFYFYGGEVSRDAELRYRGLSVRCIAR